MRAEPRLWGLICLLYEYYYKHTDKLPSEYQDILMREGRQRAVLDYIAAKYGPRYR